MASAAPRRSFLDHLHRGTVYFLAASTVYFTVECVRATYYIQKNKVERINAWREEQALQQQKERGEGGGGDGDGASASAAAAGR